MIGKNTSDNSTVVGQFGNEKTKKQMGLYICQSSNVRRLYDSRKKFSEMSLVFGWKVGSNFEIKTFDNSVKIQF